MDNTFVPSKHQAAGHDGCLISLGDNSIFAKLTNQQEIDFYNETQTLSQDDEDQLLGSKLVDWMPVFMGTLTQSDITKHDPNSVVMPVLNEDKKRVKQKLEGDDKSSEEVDDKQYIVLQNLYGGYVSPSILDIKLGSKLYDENATAEKAERLGKVSDSTTSGSLNFRICGMKLYNGNLTQTPAAEFDGMGETMKLITDDEDANYIEFDKYFGRSLSKDNVTDGLALFFDQFENAFIKRKLLETFIKRLQLLYNCLLDTEVRIISGSLLFIVENDMRKWEPVVDNDELYEARDSLIRSDFIDDDDDDDDEPGEVQSKQIADIDASLLSSLNFIDFAHAKYTKGKGYDENIIVGVENLITIFETILNKCNTYLSKTRN